ncbi:MAG: hypothetical protein H6R18_75 [Proteobacteria bacterium]|nr:hypothetical protein [Pseudomonadota bacterium]
MANKFSWLLLAILPASVLAQQVATTQPVAQPNYLDEMAKIDAQIAYIQKQNELKEALKNSSGNEGLPKVVSILVDEKGGAAQVIYDSGIVRWLKSGDVLADGVKVLAINKSSVLVGAGERQFRLAFASPKAGAATANSGMMPPLPNINIPMPLPPSASPPAASAAPVIPAAAK